MAKPFNILSSPYDRLLLTPHVLPRVINAGEKTVTFGQTISAGCALALTGASAATFGHAMGSLGLVDGLLNSALPPIVALASSVA
jgi:hypothetical protein